jgi:hypothetical protein
VNAQASPRIGEWSGQLLYTLFVGRNRGEDEIPASEFDPALKKLTDGIKGALGAYTRVRFVEAEGNTQAWGQEPTTLILVIAQPNQHEVANSTLARFATSLAKELGQDAIWVTRLRLDLFIAQHAGIIGN